MSINIFGLLTNERPSLGAKALMLPIIQAKTKMRIKESILENYFVLKELIYEEIFLWIVVTDKW